MSGRGLHPEIRAGEGRAAWTAFASLCGITSGHALLETGRDALFLARLPASALPSVYLALAFLSAGVIWLRLRLGRRRSDRRELGRWLVGSGLVTLGFWWAVGSPGDLTLYGLYLWSGLFATLIVVRFWTLADDLFTVSQAKRVFAFIGAGAGVGAIAGTALARALTGVLPARDVLLAAAVVFVLTGAGPVLLMPRPEEPTPDGEPAAPDGPRQTLRRIWDHEYLRRVAALVLVAALGFTLADYVFKSAAATHVAAADLGSFFAGAYLLLNVLGLATQLLLVGPLMRRLGLGSVLSVLPAALGAGAAGVAAGGGLLAAFTLKALDGALRHSLHRTVTEVLFVPLPALLREQAKPLVDVVGQRGGQALASLMILSLLGLGAGSAVLGVVLLALAAAWLTLARSLQGHYLALFRRALDEVALDTRADFPELDLGSLETLMRSLSSPADARVLAALDILEERRRTSLVPTLILYHPAPAVVTRALEMFTKEGREHFVPLAERLLGHEEAEVRAAALRSLSWMDPRPERYRRCLQDPSPIVRATALVGLLSHGGAGATEAAASLAQEAGGGRREQRLALARAIRYSPGAVYVDLLVQMANDPDLEVRLAVARAMREILHPRFIPPLLEMLPLRTLRRDARRTLVELGDLALEELERALADHGTDRRVRRQLPRALGHFDPSRAASALMRQFPSERDGGVAYRILRTLGRLKSRHPGLELDEPSLTDMTEQTLATAFRLTAWRVALQEGARRDSKRATYVQELIRALLAHRESLALERLFRLLSLLHPDQDLRSIYRALKSGKRSLRASGRELLETIAAPPLRAPLLALVDDLPEEDKLARAGPYLAPSSSEYEAVLVSLLERGGMAMRCLVAYHAGELGLVGLREAVRAAARGAEGLVEQTMQRALARLDLLAAPAAGEGMPRGAPVP